MSEDFKQDDLIQNFTTLQALMQRYYGQQRRSHGAFGNPHRGQGRVLALLKMQPEISQKELAFLLDIRPQSLGELLNKLAANGYIKREPSEKDRRMMLIKLTEAGRKAAEQNQGQLEEDDFFAALTFAEQKEFNQSLLKLVASLEAKLPADQKRGFAQRGERDFGGGLHGAIAQGRHPGFGSERRRHFDGTNDFC